VRLDNRKNAYDLGVAAETDSQLALDGEVFVRGVRAPSCPPAACSARAKPERYVRKMEKRIEALD
jgi:hypothetical protein